jgi:hypothetical protein
MKSIAGGYSDRRFQAWSGCLLLVNVLQQQHLFPFFTLKVALFLRLKSGNGIIAPPVE